MTTLLDRLKQAEAAATRPHKAVDHPAPECKTCEASATRDILFGNHAADLIRLVEAAKELVEARAAASLDAWQAKERTKSALRPFLAEEDAR